MKGLTTAEHQSLILSIGTHRRIRRLSPVEVANLIQKSVHAGMSRTDCATALGVQADQISRFLRLLQLHPEVRCLASWGNSDLGKVPFTTLTYLTPLTWEDQMHVTSAIIQHRITKEEVKQIIQIFRRSNASPSESVRRVLKMRSRVEDKYIFFGMIHSDDCRQYLSKLSSRQRIAAMENIIAEIIPHPHMATGRLYPSTFSIVSEKNLSELTDMDTENIEEWVNHLIRAMRD